MKIGITGTAVLAAIAIAAPVTTAFSGDVALVKYDSDIPEEVSATSRINYAGKLRMLSQRIPSAACNYVNGVGTDRTGQVLASASEEFEVILNALEKGDPALGIGSAETRQKTLYKLQALRDVWAPMKAASDAVSAGDAPDENLRTVLDSNLEVLGSAIDLVGELVSQYANPNAATQADLMLIDISGRQRMLTQKMSKEACVLANGLESDGTAESLEGTMQIFEASLDALRFGMPAVGIQAPPTDEISAGLETVATEWKEVKVLLEDTLVTKDVSEASKAQKFEALNATMVSMNNVVNLYVDYSR